MSIGWISLVYKLADWKQWKKYYPTLLFYGMGDLIYHTVFEKKHLWIFQSDFLAPPVNELFIYFAIFVPNILLFLSRFPERFTHQIAYIVLWIGIYMAIELFTTSIGMQRNYNGWSIRWSLLHNIIVFPLLIIHHKKYYVVSWITALAFMVLIMIIFKVPIIK